MPQFDTSFYLSQFFWMVMCLLILVSTFKKVFIPKMNDIITKRDEHINKYERQTKIVEDDIASVESEIASINNFRLKKTDEIIKKAIKNADEMVGNQLKAIKDENETLINGTRSRMIEEMKNIEMTSKVGIEAMAHDMFKSLFVENITRNKQSEKTK